MVHNKCAELSIEHFKCRSRLPELMKLKLMKNICKAAVHLKVPLITYSQYDDGSHFFLSLTKPHRFFIVCNFNPILKCIKVVSKSGI